MSGVWKCFFDRIADRYEREVFTLNTVSEIDFIVAELKLVSGDSVLDIGCGTGRHSIELARRGFKVTGVDISSGMLAVARKNAAAAGVPVEFVECAAQNFVPEKKYDAVLSLCEGALCLFDDDDDMWSRDMAIFANMAAALKDGGRFLVTVLNAFRLIRSISDADVAAGTVDLFTLTSRFENEVNCNEGEEPVKVKGIERYYTPSELTRMVNRIGLKIDQIYGGTAGSWLRAPIRLDEIEFMAVGRKKAEK
ncbi:MAG: cyclopropane-fatty-acyl-phospholipid synthase superfamily [uncultured bacterium]|nr:MAG: cyclopropane-fatty-acyl-phospholipid synthase superfamily [uncultured bacterium]